MKWFLTLTFVTIIHVSTYFAPAVSANDGVAQKAVLVTGASSGIGLKITEKLASNDFYVYAGARKAAAAERPLGDPSVRQPAERGPPVLELVDHLRRHLAHRLDGRLIGQVVAPLDGVERMPLGRVVAALVGARRPEQIVETAAAEPLSQEITARIDAIVAETE